MNLRVFAPALALLATAPLKPMLEASMTLHMGVQIPLLFALGWWFGRNVGLRSPLRHVDAGGFNGLLFATLVSAFWMLPVSLDAAVLDPRVGAAKVATLLLAGIAARHAFARTGIAMQAFFVLNWVWMSATAGIVLQDLPERVCSVYLQDDQTHAGIALVVLSVLVAVAWMGFAMRRLSLSPSTAAA